MLSSSVVHAHAISCALCTPGATPDFSVLSVDMTCCHILGYILGRGNTTCTTTQDRRIRKDYVALTQMPCLAHAQLPSSTACVQQSTTSSTDLPYAVSGCCHPCACSSGKHFRARSNSCSQRLP
jgi:hypothetical protein